MVNMLNALGFETIQNRNKCEVNHINLIMHLLAFTLQFKLN